MDNEEAVVVGAGPGGLAAAAVLARNSISTRILERGPSVATSWRRHYDRLHLHTVRWLSALPGLRIPRDKGAWVARDDVIAYLEAYARHHHLRIESGVEVTRLDRQDGGWILSTSAGVRAARWVVVATGFNCVPDLPDWPGRSGFAGPVVHSSQYGHAAAYRGQDVLVIGAGNSACEIAVDLVEGGARTVWVAVRTPPNIIRRSVAGIPTQAIALALSPLPPRVLDAVGRTVQRVTVGDLTAYGLPRPAHGMVTYNRAERVIPTVDVGFLDLVRARRISIVGAVQAFENGEVILVGGDRLRPQAVIAATGFKTGLEPMAAHLGVLNARGWPLASGAELPQAPGLFFIGYSVPVVGQFRENGIEARRIARAIDSDRRRRHVHLPQPVGSAE